MLQKAAEQFDREVTSSTASLTENMDAIRSQVANVDSQIKETSDKFQGFFADSEATITQRISEAENNTNHSLSSMKETAESLLQAAGDSAQRLNDELADIHETFQKYETHRAEEFMESQAQRAESQIHVDAEYHEWFETNKNEITGLQELARATLEEVAGARDALNKSPFR